MKKAMLALAATSVIALSACGTSSSDKIVTSKAGDITKKILRANEDTSW